MYEMIFCHAMLSFILKDIGGAVGLMLVKDGKSWSPDYRIELDEV
jgi:hypothetical protein